MTRTTITKAAVALALGGLLTACAGMGGDNSSPSATGANTSATAPDTSSTQNPSTPPAGTAPNTTTGGSENPPAPGPHA